MRHSTGYARRLAATVAVSAAAALAAGFFTGSAAQAAEGDIRGAGAAGAIADRYIVVFKDSAPAGTRVPAAARELSARVGGGVVREYSGAVKGFTGRLTESAARRLAADPSVAYVEQDRTVRMSDTQTGATWGLDRVDQRALPLSGTYTYPNTAGNVTAYILDTGVRLTHSEIAGRATSGYDFIDNDADASDCQGHGTHVAGTVAGRTYGVAKAANGSGSYSAIIAGIDWVTSHAVKPAVVNMSLGGSASAALDTAVRTSIASGVTYAVAAGNDNKDACVVSPARTAEAITVGATDSADARASFSNYGACLDIFAPGVNITSSAVGGDAATTRMSGTSMATPHVAGLAALVLAANPGFTPAQVRAALVDGGTAGLVTNPAAGSPNVLLNTAAVVTPAPAPAPVPVPTPLPVTTCTVTNGFDKAIADRATVESKLTVTGCAGTGSATATVRVQVRHADRGDLAVWLVAPDGTAYKLKSATAGDNVANLDATYTVNLSTETRDGAWKLRISDMYSGDTGALDAWTLTA